MCMFVIFGLLIMLIIDGEALEIIHSVASACPPVCLSVNAQRQRSRSKFGVKVKCLARSGRCQELGFAKYSKKDLRNTDQPNRLPKGSITNPHVCLQWCDEYIFIVPRLNEVLQSPFVCPSFCPYGSTISEIKHFCPHLNISQHCATLPTNKSLRRGTPRATCTHFFYWNDTHFIVLIRLK